MLEVEMMYVVLTLPKKTGSITNLSLNYIAGNVGTLSSRWGIGRSFLGSRQRIDLDPMRFLQRWNRFFLRVMDAEMPGKTPWSRPRVGRSH